MTKRKISGTNMVERTPRGAKAPADQSGHQGAALAATILNRADKVGELTEQIGSMRKLDLAALIGLSIEERAEFTKEMVSVTATVGEMILASKMTREDYFLDHPKMEYRTTEASMWRGIVAAVDAGWAPMNPEGDKIPDMQDWPSWSVIRKQAIAYKEKAQADSGTTPLTRAGTKRRKAGRTPDSVLSKVAKGVKNALKDDKGVMKQPSPEDAAKIITATITAVSGNNRNLAEIVDNILEGPPAATLDELKEVAARVEARMVAATQAAEVAAKATAKAAAGSKDKTVEIGTTTTSQGATVRRSAAVPRSSAPVANPESKADALIEAAANAQKQVESERKSRRRQAA